MSEVTKPVMLDETGKAIAAMLCGIAGALDGNTVKWNRSKVTSLDGTPLICCGAVIEAVGIPKYVSDPSEYADYGIEENGWYIFARVTAQDGVVFTADTSINGAAGHIAAYGMGYVDLAVRFGVTADAVRVVINWGPYSDEMLFTARDLAVRNLDYRTTFYIYDIAPYATWEYALTTDETFVADKAYYTEADGVYTLAEVTAGEAVPAYYVQTGEETYERATGTFMDGVTYYTYDGTTYTAAEVTTGAAIPAYYNHSKLKYAGMVANVTYRLNDMVDCPIEITLPEVADDGHGAWFEIQMRYNGSYSVTLIPPEGVKIGTAQTQAQTAGVNTIDLQYTDAGDVKMWTLLNTHSNIPA